MYFEIKCQFRQKNLTKSFSFSVADLESVSSHSQMPSITTDGKYLAEVIKQMDMLKLDLVLLRFKQTLKNTELFTSQFTNVYQIGFFIKTS